MERGQEHLGFHTLVFSSQALYYPPTFSDFLDSLIRAQQHSVRERDSEREEEGRRGGKEEKTKDKEKCNKRWQRSESRPEIPGLGERGEQAWE